MTATKDYSVLQHALPRYIDNRSLFVIFTEGLITSYYSVLMLQKYAFIED